MYLNNNYLSLTIKKNIKVFIYILNNMIRSFSNSPKNCEPGAHFKQEPNPPYLSTIIHKNSPPNFLSHSSFIYFAISSYSDFF